MIQMVFKKDLVTKIICYESGEMNDNQTLEFFSELIKAKLYWELLGHYGRIVTVYIEAGYLDNKGNILKRF